MLENLQILLADSGTPSPSLTRAGRFAARLAADQGAHVHCDSPADLSNAFYQIANETIENGDMIEWASRAPEGVHRILVVAGEKQVSDLSDFPDSISVVLVESETWQSEATLFAGSALADLLGDPNRAPLVPAAHYAAHCIGYAIYCAITSIHTGWRRFGQAEKAKIDGHAALGWINWKAAAAGYMGRDIHREGEQAEWPVLPCKDGDVAFLFTERDWDLVRNMIQDTRLDDERFRTFKGRAENRDGYMGVIREWVLHWTKAELNVKFEEARIPGAAVSTISDLLEDPLLLHRKSFAQSSKGATLPTAPHKIARQENGLPESAGLAASPEIRLPLAGIKVLDLGIITAGAGVGALLADLGAEVLKVESETYPDPFRMWAGATDGDSPLFKFNNRNKKGVAIDLKTGSGKAHFLELAKSADIVIENFRRGVLDRLGLTFDVLRRANPNILLGSISGQGLSGPGANHTTFGSTLEASSGFASLTCYDDKVPVISGRNLNYPDQIVCLYGAAAIVGAVAECKLSGQAMHVDVSQRDCAVYQAGDVIAEVSQGASDDPEDVRARVLGGRLDGFFVSGDGDYVALSAVNRSALTAIEGLEATDDAAIAIWASKRPAVEIVSAFLDAGLGAQKNLSGSEMFAHPTIQQAGVFDKSPGGDLVKGFPFLLSKASLSIHSDSPTVGQHTNEYLAA